MIETPPAAVYNGERVFPFPDEEDADVPPPVTRPTNDASRLSFPVQMVVAIVFASLSAAGTVWATQSSSTAQQSALRSDVRDILTRMELQAKIAEAQSKLQEERTASMAKNISAVEARLQLYQYELQQFKDGLKRQ